MLNKAKKIAHRLTGLFLDESQKLELLRGALESKDLKLVETALMRGCKPAMKEIGFLLRSDEPPSLELFKNLCELFLKFGANLNESTGGIDKDYERGFTIISGVIRGCNYLEGAIEYLLDRGVEPSGADIWTACQLESNPKYLKVLLDSGIDPYSYVPPEVMTEGCCVLSQVIKYRDLEKLKLVSQYPYKGNLPIDVGKTLHKLFLAAENKEGLTSEFADFATEATKYIGYLKEDALRIHSKYW